MDVSLFQNLLKNLLQTPVYIVSDDNNELDEIEKNLFDIKLQPMFNKSSLTLLIEAAKESVFYEIIDGLNISMLLFKFNDYVFMVGPYLKHGYDEKEIDRILISLNLPLSHKSTLNLYCTNLSILHYTEISKTIFACMKSFDNSVEPPTYRRLHGVKETNTTSYESQHIYDFDNIYKRYDLERYFMNNITFGNIEGVESAFFDLSSQSFSEESSLQVDLYKSPQAAFSVLRVLARKAAEQGGLSVIKIDEITQKNAKEISNSSSIREMTDSFYNMLIELTTEVRNTIYETGSYSSYVKSAIEYISLNLSQNITTGDIASFVNVSISLLEKKFKAETNETIINYIAKKRCQTAAKMLKETDLPISDIGVYVGYLDNNYFTKVFKKFYNTTPSKYRNDSINKKI